MTANLVGTCLGIGCSVSRDLWRHMVKGQKQHLGLRMLPNQNYQDAEALEIRVGHLTLHILHCMNAKWQMSRDRSSNLCEKGVSRTNYSLWWVCAWGWNAVVPRERWRQGSNVIGQITKNIILGHYADTKITTCRNSQYHVGYHPLKVYNALFNLKQLWYDNTDQGIRVSHMSSPSNGQK